MTQTPTLSEALDAALGGSAGTITAGAGDITVEVNITDIDRIGVVVDRISVQGGTGSLHERAQRITDRVTPDGQSMRPVEIDARLGGGQLRSPVDSRRRYFEASVTESAIEIRRNQLTEDNDRTPADLTMTRGQLGELIDQLEDVVDPIEGPT